MSPDIDEPEEFLISLGPRVVVDWPGYIAALIGDQWDTQFTDGLDPQVMLAESGRVARIGDRDLVVVNQVSQTTKNASVGFDFVKEKHVVSLDLWSAQARDGRSHAIKFFEEVRRAIMRNRVDTVPISAGATGRVWMEWDIRSKPFDQQYKGIYRRQVDVRINHEFRQVLT